MKAYTIFAAASLAALLGGCAAPGPTPEMLARLEAADKIQASDRLIQERLQESGKSIARTLSLIDRIERGGAPAPAADQTPASYRAAASAPAYAPDMLEARLRIEWTNGSAEELLAALAKQMGIEFRATGTRRALPPVTVVSSAETMRSILSSVGRQVDRGADVVLSKTSQPAVLELRYK